MSMWAIWSIFLLLIVAFGFFLYLLKKEPKQDTQTPSSAGYAEVSGVSEENKERAKIKFPSDIADIEVTQPAFRALREALHRQIIWQNGLIHTLFVGILTWGHILIEWVPGLAKTKTVTSLAHLLHVECKRVQCTPDMLPSDLTGTEIFHHETKQFEIIPGPLFANIILADEINRTTPKVQAALLEAMQEQQVTIGGKTLPLPKPFLVLATQNPLDHEWTYPLPEAQVDRFLCKIIVSYPSQQEEVKILHQAQSLNTGDTDAIHMNAEELLKMQKLVAEISVSEDILHQTVELARRTRSVTSLLSYWASPRASLAMIHAAKAVAYLAGRTEVKQSDVQCVALSVLRHRVGMTYQAAQVYKDTDVLLRDILIS